MWIDPKRHLTPGRSHALLVTLVCMALLLVTKASLADEQALWAALRSGGHVALLRHALAPGTGDPEDFDVSNCTTQRNLSDAGRAQAARIGERFKANGIRTARVFSSQWCRCLDTGRLLRLGPVEQLPALNSFYGRFENEAAQTRAARSWLSRQAHNDVVVLVTHQVNIYALTGAPTSSGEMVVARSLSTGELQVLGTIATDLSR